MRYESIKDDKIKGKNFPASASDDERKNELEKRLKRSAELH